MSDFRLSGRSEAPLFQENLADFYRKRQKAHFVDIVQNRWGYIFPYFPYARRATGERQGAERLKDQGARTLYRIVVKWKQVTP